MCPKLLLVSLVGYVAADLRFASQAHASYSLRTEAGQIPFVRQNIFYRYMIPSSFGYKKLGPLGRPAQGFPGFGGRGRRPGGSLLSKSEEQENEAKLPPLTAEERKDLDLLQFGPRGPGGRGRPGGFQMPPRGQKYRNYDNFLRSNIDNEQDNRDFTNDAGRDHLPFRTNETEIYSHFNTDHVDHRKMAKVGPIDLRKELKPGQSLMIPVRWNNPHVSEIEVNIWIFPQKSQPVVVPIKKPTCSAEGHQDNIISFTVPKDFTQLGAKIPGFKGCNKDTKPLCVLQVYAHSVESRMYAYGFPIIIPGHDNSKTTTSTDGIKPQPTDPGIDIGGLRDFCRDGADPKQHIPNAVPQWALLVSDLYTHAYMNSNYSPYSGQQPREISKNLQASAINKMWAGNRGELGASILPSAKKTRLGELNTLEGRVYKRYEKMANRLIKRLEAARQLFTTGYVSAEGTKQKLAHCFRCREVGSVNAKRLNTNTYIPSFQLPKNLVQPARRMIPPMFQRLINSKGQVVVYLAALRDLLPFFQASQVMGIIYQQPMLKTTLATFPSATQHKKRNAKGVEDGGVYSAKLAKKDLVESIGCPFACLWAKEGKAPLINGAKATSVTGKCAKCAALFKTEAKPGEKPAPLTEMAQYIAKNGAPSDDGIKKEDDVPEYPDRDGSADEVGRPAQPGEATAAPQTKKNWDLPGAQQQQQPQRGGGMPRRGMPGGGMPGRGMPGGGRPRPGFGRGGALLQEQDDQRPRPDTRGTRRRRRRTQQRSDDSHEGTLHPEWFASLLQEQDSASSFPW